MTDLLCETGLTRALCRNGRDSQLLLEEEGGGREGGEGEREEREGEREEGREGRREVNTEKERTKGRREGAPLTSIYHLHIMNQYSITT